MDYSKASQSHLFVCSKLPVEGEYGANSVIMTEVMLNFNIIITPGAHVKVDYMYIFSENVFSSRNCAVTGTG